MSVRVILSTHWIKAWNKRIDQASVDRRYLSSVIAAAIDAGNTRVRRDLSLGVLVELEWNGQPAYVVGSFNERKEFIAKTVMDEQTASVMGWKPKREGLRAPLMEVLKCGTK